VLISCSARLRTWAGGFDGGRARVHDAEQKGKRAKKGVSKWFCAVCSRVLHFFFEKVFTPGGTVPVSFFAGSDFFRIKRAPLAQY
jgi:hypothetical protein